MSELVVSEMSIEYTTNKSSDDLLLRIFKETSKDGIIVIDYNDNIIFINEIAKKLIGPLLNNDNGNKIDIPYSISKERIVHLKVNPSKYRTISVNASKFTYRRKKYHLLTIKQIKEVIESARNRPTVIEKSNCYLHYIYDFNTKKFKYLNNAIKRFLGLDDNQSDIKASIIDKINYSDQNILVDKINSIEISENDDEEEFFEINYRYNILENNYFILDFIKITKSEGKLKQIESNAIVLSNSQKFINKFSENDKIQNVVGNSLSLGIYRIDLINGTFEVSDSFYKFLGYKYAKLDPLFENFKGLVHKDDLANILDNNQNYLQSKEKYFQRIFRVKQNNGSYKWLESRGTITSFDETGKPSKIVGQFFDRTKEQNDIEQVLYYKNIFNVLLNNSNDIIFVIDEKGKLYHLSQSVEKLTGVKNDEFLNKHIWDTLLMTMSDEEREKIDYELHKSLILDSLRCAIHNENSQSSLSKHYSKNGSEFYLETALYPVNINNGAPPYLIAIAKDVTSLKIFQDELKEREVIYNELMDNSTDAIIVFEPDSEHIIYANNVAAKLYALPKDDFIGQSMIDFSLNQELGSVKVKETISRKGIVTFKTKHKNATGKKFQVQITGSYINYKGQNVVLSINKFIKYIK